MQSRELKVIESEKDWWEQELSEHELHCMDTSNIQSTAWSRRPNSHKLNDVYLTAGF